jgi:hypothetical protein
MRWIGIYALFYFLPLAQIQAQQSDTTNARTAADSTRTHTSTSHAPILKKKPDSPVVRPEPIVITLAFPDTSHLDPLKKEIHSVRQMMEYTYGCLLFLFLLIIAGLWWTCWIYHSVRILRVSGEKPTLAAAEGPSVAGPGIEKEKLPDEDTPRAPDPTPAKGFICEIMMTAGPRKKFMNEHDADKDLGEDVCGCVIHGDRLGLWLLDGTSDQHCLIDPLAGREYFSSRLLAQYIGDRLRMELTTAGGYGHPLDRVIQEAIEGVRMAWVGVLRQLPEAEIRLLETNIRDRNFPECSSTLLMARLSLDGELAAFRSGDSKMLLFRDPVRRQNGQNQNGQNIADRLIPLSNSFTSKNPEANDRIFFRIVLDKNGELDILCNKPAYEIMVQEKISNLIAFSDGIGATTEGALQEEYFQDPDSVRRRIITHSQGTADDKSICFIGIKDNG